MHIGLFLDSGYGLLAYAAIYEVLHQVRRRSPSLQLSWESIGLTKEPITSCSDHQALPDCSIKAETQYDMILLFSTRSETPKPELIDWLKFHSKRGTTLGGVVSGSWILAWAGLLRNYRCTVHWQDLETFRETFPSINACSDLYVIDRKRMTCSGGHAAADMMMHYLSDKVNANVITEVAESLIHEHIRPPHEQQRLPLSIRLTTSHPQVIALAHYLETSDYSSSHIKTFCEQQKVSVRWMEKLFKKHIGKGPKAYQMMLRQSRARDLLKGTDMSVGEIAAILDYANAAYFSNAFKKHHGSSPSEFRNSEALYLKRTWE